ncbi:glycosyl hydrolase, partial [Actinoplanes sp. NPDC051633]
EALADLRGLRGTLSPWLEVTDQPYDADDPNYRDPFFSNSGSGWGNVAGRVTGLDAGRGYMWAGGANGGVFRKSLTSRYAQWRPISERILALSTGDLVYDERADTLWYATGEANTGGTTYTGAGVYRLRNARSASFTDADRVGGDELESRSINQLKFDGRGLVYAATTRGLWRHSTDPKRHREPWQLVLMPNPASDGDVTKPYDNIVNDVLIPPVERGATVLANAAWRSGAAYNGFYLSTIGGAPGSFTKQPLTGDVNNADVGNAEFAVSGNGRRFTMVLEQPSTVGVASNLQGVFVAGAVLGPWTKIADSTELENSGSAIGVDQNYPVGIQAWYNNFIEVDPARPDHIYVGLEEVYETEDGGATWKTIGPYWNLGFDCFDPARPDGGCPPTT